MHKLKEQLDLNAATRSLILTILASFYIPLAFVSSYFGMNASGFTDGGLVSTTTFWQISVPLVVASIIIPVTFSGLLIRIFMEVAHSLYGVLLSLRYNIQIKFWSWWIGSMVKIVFSIFRQKFTRTSTGVTDTGTNAA